MSGYDFFKKVSDTARTGFDKQTPAGASFSAFRLFAKSINQALMNDRKDLEQQKQEIEKEYSVKVAGERIAELESVYNATVKTKQESLKRVLEKLIASKRNAIEQFTTIPPTDRQLRLIDSVSRREGKISDTEWNMIVSECSSNYQASAILQDFAEKHNKSYQLPFEPESELEKLDRLNEKLTTRIIDHIGENPIDAGFDIAEFYAHDSSRGTYGVINSLCEEFDSSAPAYVAESLVDLTDPAELVSRLLEARSIAYQNKANELFSEIVRVHMNIRDNGLNESNLNRAEQLITLVRTLFPNNAGVGTDDRKPGSVGSAISDLLKSPGHDAGGSV